MPRKGKSENSKVEEPTTKESFFILTLLVFSIWGFGKFVGGVNLISTCLGILVTLFVYKCIRVFKSKDFKKAWKKYDLY